jgi:hypothetical protein
VSEEEDAPRTTSTPSKYKGRNTRKQQDPVRFEDMGELSTNTSVLLADLVMIPGTEPSTFARLSKAMNFSEISSASLTERESSRYKWSTNI